MWTFWVCIRMGKVPCTLHVHDDPLVAYSDDHSHLRNPGGAREAGA
jgi:hypothetical protein